MSAFVVAPETISSVVDVVAKYETVYNRDMLAKRLFLLNVESVNQRYQLKDGDVVSRNEYESYLADAEKIRYQEQPERHPAQHIQAIRCWIYQSCEGNCEDDPLFLVVSKIRDKESLAVASEINGSPVSNSDRAYNIISNYIDKNNLDSAWN
jgi:hypothetical protein